MCEFVMHDGGGGLLGKMVPEVLDTEDGGSGLSLITPLFTICIEDAMTKKRMRGVVEQATLDIIFKIAFSTKKKKKRRSFMTISTPAAP